MNEITIPKKLQPLVQAFYEESPKTAKALIRQTAEAIYGSSDCFRRGPAISEDDLEQVCTMMSGIHPKDMLEALLAAQIVATHMLGMIKLATGYLPDQQLGVKLLRFSGESLERLQKKRAGGYQNITVNYHGHEHKPHFSSAIPVQAQVNE